MEYKELVKKTKEFYKKLEITLCDNDEKLINLAITSLTMPEFAKEYNDVHTEKIYDHRSLATVGDSICTALLMMKEFSIELSMGEMTEKKDALQNKSLNSIGEKLLKGHLFARNNDLNNQNGKSYATAFEAVIGFLSFLDLKSAKKIFNEQIKETL